VDSTVMKYCTRCYRWGTFMVGLF